MKRPRFWVGHKFGKRVAFTFPGRPTVETHGDLYAAIVGPFRTRRGAEWDAEHPHFYGSIAEAEKYAKLEADIPKTFPVRPLKRGEITEDKVTCGTCWRSWDDAVITSMTPAPSGRCPFEAFHD